MLSYCKTKGTRVVKIVQISPSLQWGFRALLQLIQRHRARSEISLKASTEKLVTTSTSCEHQLRTTLPSLHSDDPKQYWPFRIEHLRDLILNRKDSHSSPFPTSGSQ